MPSPGPDSFLDYTKADVFAVGMIAHDMLGEAPFDTEDTRFIRIANYRPLPTCYPDVLRDAVRGMIHPDPARRLTAAAALAALQPLL